MRPLGAMSGRPPGPASRIPRPASSPATIDARGYRRSEPVDVCALPEQGQLVALSPHPPSFQWLNSHAWLIYSLCDGSDLSSLRMRYQEASEGGGSDLA